MGGLCRGAGGHGRLLGLRARATGDRPGPRPGNIAGWPLAPARRDPFLAPPAASRLSQPARKGPFRPRWPVRRYQLAAGRRPGARDLWRQRRVLGSAREHGKTGHRQELRPSQIPKQPHQRMGRCGRAGQTACGLAVRCAGTMRPRGHFGTLWLVPHGKARAQVVPAPLRPCFGGGCGRGVPGRRPPLMVGDDGRRAVKYNCFAEIYVARAVAWLLTPGDRQ